jgi:guanosine-3',5'-bis(diphosphate) 3'-pyrophosphohydrolase
VKLDGLLNKVEEYLPSAPLDVVRRAYEFSAEKHKNQRRASGEPYVTHPLEVANIIADLRLDVPSIATGLLHDTVEDTLTTLENIEAGFGPEVASLVDGVTKISQINFASREEQEAENFRKMILAMSKDVRVILIKLADRTHNMRTLGALSPARRRKIAQETLDIYAPLAHRLGIYWMKSEMEDAALQALHPEIYYQLKRFVSQKKTEREKYIREVHRQLERKLESSGIEAQVSGRPKHFYSIYQKMVTQNLLYEQLFDLVAFRIVVDSKRDCYEALGCVHEQWRPIPGRFKDYIALPKANGYQSLHTAVLGPQAERIEVQIRSIEMHRVAEEGVAAHWKYKGGYAGAQEELQRFQWLSQMLDWQQQVKDPEEFLDGFKEDLFADEVYVFTPKGDLRHFPKGATVVDFAYRVHSEVGHRCTGARVGGRLVPLRYQLQNGDMVEIITTQKQTPSRDWLKFVRTPRAKERVRAWVKEQQASRSLEVGREILARDFARVGLDVARLVREGVLASAAEALNQKDADSLIAQVGYGRMTSREVLAEIAPEADLDHPSEPGRLERIIRSVSRRTAEGGVRVSSLPDVLVRFARCCDPIPGERIAGFLTRGRGVTVHAATCSRVLEADPLRRVDCVWDTENQAPRPVKIEVGCVDERGQLAGISRAIAGAGINIRKAESRAIEDGKAINTFEVMVQNIEELGRLIRRLSRLKGVISVERIRV